MRIRRLFTVNGEDAYAGVPFARADLELTGENGRAEARFPQVEIPADWPYQSVAALLDLGLKKQDVPQKLRQVEEHGVPSWLWRCEPYDRNGIAEDGYETSFKQVFDRIAGALAYTGWKAGYFTAEADAHAFYDEMRYLLATQRLALAPAHYRLTGLYWAYGLEGEARERVWIDPRSNRLRTRALDRMHPDLLEPVGNAGIMAADGPDLRDYINRKYFAEAELSARAVGGRLVERQLERIYAASLNPDELEPLVNAAHALGISEKLLQTVIERGRAGEPMQPLPRFDQAPDAQTESGSGRHVLLKDAKDSFLWRDLTNAMGQHGDPGILFARQIEDWMGLHSPRRHLGISEDGGALLEAGGVVSRGAINLEAFLRDEGGFDNVGFAHACSLATIALDLTLQLSSYDDENAARRAQEDRPLSLGLANLAPLLMALGHGYDTPHGRSMAGAIAALMTGAALAASGDLAASLGMAGGFPEHRDETLRLMRNQRRAAYGETDGYESVSIAPPSLLLDSSPDLALVAAVRRVWDRAVEAAHTVGLRNLHLTGIDSAWIIRDLLGADSAGIMPLPGLWQEYQTGEEEFVRQLHPAFAEVLDALGYEPMEQQAIVMGYGGWRGLSGAPVINEASLAALGFDDAAIEKADAALASAVHIRQAFHPWVIGRDFCMDKFGLTAMECDDPHFDLLAAVGFTAEEIEVANLYCCGIGNLEDIPELKPEHRQIFACLDAAGEGGLAADAVIRMAGAMQCFISGNIAFPLPLRDMAAGETARLARLAEQSGLKSLRFMPPLAVFEDVREFMQDDAFDALLASLIEVATPLPPGAEGRGNGLGEFDWSHAKPLHPARRRAGLRIITDSDPAARLRVRVSGAGTVAADNVS